MHRPTALSLASLWISLLTLVVALGGCSDSPESPVVDPYLPIVGGALPEVVFEGESAEIHAWGEIDRGRGAFQSLEIEILSHPGTEAGEIEVRARANESSRPTGPDFESRISLPALRPGQYLVRFVGHGFTRTLSVLSRIGWVRYRSYHGPMSPDEGLLISGDGEAIVYRQGLGRSEKQQLSRERIAEIDSWFRAVDFASFEPEYLSGDRNRMRVVEVTLATPDANAVHRVVAEEDLMPDGLARLTSQLSRLVDELLEDRSHPPRLTGRVSILPVEAEPGVARRIELSLVNDGDEPITLEFPTPQQHDFWLLRTGDSPHPHGDPPGDGPVRDDDHDPGRTLIWSWSHGLSFPAEVTYLTLAPGRVHTIRAEWDGLDNRHHEVGPGIYVMSGILPTLRHDRVVAIEPARLVVRGQVPDRMPLVGTLSVTPATAPHGTPRQITLAITNLNRTSIELEFIDTQRFDLAIHGRPTGSRTDPNDRGLIWQWSEGRGFGDAIGYVTWAPGETHTFVETWDGIHRDGTAVGPGHYSLRGWLTTRPGAAVRPVSIVVNE